MSSTAPITIGVLIPSSRIYPSLGQDLLAGIQLALAEAGGQVAGRDVRLAAEDIGVGQILPEQKSLKLLGFDGARLVIGLLNTAVVATLQQLYAERQACLIAVSAGENVPRRSELNSSCSSVSLGLWQGNVALGAWAAHHVGQRALMVQSFYDSGYDLPFCFRHGFGEAGGEVAHTFLTHRPPNDGDFQPVFAWIAEHRPDLVFASYCGPAATAFVRAYAEAGFAGRIPLLGSGLLTEPALLAEQGEAALGIRSAIALGPADTPAAHAFTVAFQAHTGRVPGPLAAPAYEAGRLALAALSAVEGDLSRADDLQAALAAAQVDGPRGPLTMHPETRTLMPAAVTVREVRPDAGGWAHVALADLPAIAETDLLMRPIVENVRSGWLNPYLCV